MVGAVLTAKEIRDWKWNLRKYVWDSYEGSGPIGDFIPPEFRKHPNFIGTQDAAARLSELPEFEEASVVKIGMENQLRPIVNKALEMGKTVLIQQPFGQKTGFFSSLQVAPEYAWRASSVSGARDFAQDIALGDSVPNVDLFIMGSVAVNPKNGCRVGKGGGFADIDYAVLRELGSVDESTPVVTIVAEEQLLGIPAERTQVFDVRCDVIVTPDRTFRIADRVPKPTGICWDQLSESRLGSTPLGRLRDSLPKVQVAS
jgi:5-formyltetrahydrofolate cyclo-ligase